MRYLFLFALMNALHIHAFGLGLKSFNSMYHYECSGKNVDSVLSTIEEYDNLMHGKQNSRLMDQRTYNKLRSMQAANDKISNCVGSKGAHSANERTISAYKLSKDHPNFTQSFYNACDSNELFLKTFRADCEIASQAMKFVLKAQRRPDDNIHSFTSKPAKVVAKEDNNKPENSAAPQRAKPPMPNAPEMPNTPPMYNGQGNFYPQYEQQQPPMYANEPYPNQAPPMYYSNTPPMYYQQQVNPGQQQFEQPMSMPEPVPPYDAQSEYNSNAQKPMVQYYPMPMQQPMMSYYGQPMMMPQQGQESLEMQQPMQSKNMQQMMQQPMMGYYGQPMYYPQQPMGYGQPMMFNNQATNGSNDDYMGYVPAQ